MGWIPKLDWQGIRVSRRSPSRRGVRQLVTDTKTSYNFCKYSKQVSRLLMKLHRDFSLAVAVGAVDTPQDLSELLEKHAYHDTWRLRSHAIGVRVLARKAKATGAGCSIEDYLKVCPDEKKYVRTLGEARGVSTVKDLASWLDYKKDIFQFSCDCCFVGWLFPWELGPWNRKSIRKYREEKAIVWNGHVLHPHPVVVCRAVCDKVDE